MRKQIIRVFPVRTNATPDDDLVRVKTVPSLLDMNMKVDAVHISVAFSWHKRWAEWAARQWERVAPVSVGGPAYNEPGGDFVPGRYMKRGYVIMSRGCPICDHRENMNRPDVLRRGCDPVKYRTDGNDVD